MHQNGDQITIGLQEWKQLQEELAKLKQENLNLKAKLDATSPQPLIIRNRLSMTLSNVSLDGQQKKSFNPKIAFKNQMAQWSKRISSKYHSKFGLQKFITTLENIQQSKEEQAHHGSHDSIQIKQELSSQKQQVVEDPNNITEILVKANKNKQKQIIDQIPQVRQTNAINGINCLTRKQSKGLKIKSKEFIKQLKQMRLIQSICLFGPSEQSFSNQLNNRKMFVKNSLLYSSIQQQNEKFEIYGQYFYPQGLIAAKNIKEEEAATQINQVIFRKNTKKEDCCLFLFRGDDNNQQLKVQNPIIEKVNPGRWLSCFFVQFTDFQIVTVEDTPQYIDDKLNRSDTVTHQMREKDENETHGQQSDRTKTKNISNKYIKSKYTLCIFTYFPFINIFQQLLSCILDEIKIRRVEKYAQLNQMKQVSIKFLVNQLKTLGPQIHSQIEKIPIAFGEHMTICFGSFKIIFDMSEARFDELLFSGWVFDIVKLFEKQVLFDIYTNLMTEESICFVCQNMHILSYAIFFFVCILPYPFTYPHPCISQVFNYQLLQSPFVVTAGINQSTKWLEQSVFAYPKKIFVDLNDDSKVKGKKKLKTLKSQKLKKIFNILYKKIQNNNSSMPQLFKKKGTIIRPASKEENECVFNFMKSLQHFYEQEIFSQLPNPAIITFIRDKIDQKNETSKIFNILKQIEKYMKQSRKHKEKDQFIDSLVQQQIFYVHMGIIYNLD